MRLHRFAVISGLGWTMDIGIMAALVWQGLPTFWANVIGASVALTFVFIVSQRRLFVHGGVFLLPKFAAYCLFQSVAVPLASAAIHLLAGLLEGSGWLVALLPVVGAPVAGWPVTPPLHVLASVLAKGLVTPATLYGNFLFMGWLLERRLSFL